MLAYYGTEISPNQTETVEGFLVCRNVPIARTGPQEYLAHELQLDGDPDRVIVVNRHPEDVFEDATLASFEGKPVTDGHPPENVGPENYGAYLKGHTQNVRKSGDFIVADLYINDKSLANDIMNGAKREVSCGYLCNYEPEGEEYRQTKIRGNHVAVVPRGRAGHDVAIKDHAAEEAGKGRKIMSKFSRAILSAFGAAAKDAAPDEMAEMVDAANAALEAAPADEAQEEVPAKKAADAEEKTEDVEVERAPKGDDLGTKLDKLLEMLGELMHKEDKEEKHLSDESDLDKAVKDLEGKEEVEEEESSEESVTVPAEEMEDEEPDEATKAAAIEFLKKVRPAIADIKDKAEKARVTDALLSAIKGPNTMSDIMKANKGAAQKAADAASKNSYVNMCETQQSVYDALNPHKSKKED